MKTIVTNKVLVNFKGDNLTDGKEEVKVGTILSNVCAGKVSNPTLGWILGKKFATEESVDLKAEEVVFLKREIEICCGSNSWMTALVGGQLIELLDSKDE